MFEFTIHPAKRRISVILSGELTARDLIEVLERVSAHPDFDPAFEVMVNGIGVKRMPALHELREVAITVRRMAKVPGARRAIVTSSESFYALANLFAVMTAGAVSKYRVFLTSVDAEAWLRGDSAD